MESSHVVELFLALGLIIGIAQLAGAAARAAKQPRVFGELVAGVLLGPTLINMLHWSSFSEPEQIMHTIEEFAELGVLFMMFTIGLEVHLRELISVGRVAIWGGTLGALLPLMLALPIVLVFNYSAESSIFVGVVLAATSVSISAQTLLELGVLRTKEGMGLLATAVVDDVFAILLLSIVVATLGPDTNASAGDLIWIFARMTLYLGGALLLAWRALPWLFNRIHHTPQIASGTASFALITALIFGWSAEALGGIAPITGAFIAGLGLARANARVRSEVENTVRQISYAFLVPIFFVNVGLHADLLAIPLDVLPLAGLLLIAAVVAKIIGCGAGARLGGFSNGESLRLGVCMISRGEVGLIIASVGKASGLLSDGLFEPLFLVILLTTVLTPPLVRRVFAPQLKSPPALITKQG
ncbi:MAG: cation:proton antiporter [Chloroflexi bacterium]|nr:cation:proton antiporter [Chloroflexota bacterium]